MSHAIFDILPLEKSMDSLYANKYAIYINGNKATKGNFDIY